MRLRLSNLKSWGAIVFVFLIFLRILLWVSVEWPAGKVSPTSPNNGFVKVHNLPIHFLVHWVDSGRYWPPSPNTFKESLFLILHDTNRQFHLQYLFFLPFRIITNDIAYGVLVQNILSLVTAWMLYTMLRVYGKRFAAFAVFISFANLITISMEYALLREVLSRFLLILLLFLLWRMVISPSWRLTIAVSMVLFLLPWSRSEFMIVIFLCIPILLWRFSLKYAMVIILIGLLGVYTFREVCGSQSKFFMFYQLRQNLLVSSYNYKSPDIEDLPKRIYNKAVQYKDLYGIYPQWPSFRYQGFEVVIEDTIREWKEENKRADVNYDVLFLDVLKNNTKYVLYSALYSFWSFMTGNLITISPLIYAGNNSSYIYAWIYYSSPNLTRFNDPISELNPSERGAKWLTVILAPLSEYWLRKICAPFFLIGLFCIGRIFFIKRRVIQPSLMVFWLLAVLWTVVTLLIMCFIGLRCSRYLFAIDPFIFTISVLGMEIAGKAFFNCIPGKYKNLPPRHKGTKEKNNKNL